MNYYFIYSAGGGAGDWNGIKRIWTDSMPKEMKSSILLKFGDVYLNHVSSNSIIRQQRWNDISNLRNWLFKATNDSFVLNDSNILLDSGSAKIVAWIAHHNPSISCCKLISLFDETIKANNILEKYVDVIIESNITNAITFDIPNPFKIRSQNGDTRLNLLNHDNNKSLIEASAKYANKMYNLLQTKAPYLNIDSILMTTINGTWSIDELNYFFSLLNYTPINLGIGGLSSMRRKALNEYIPVLKTLGLHKYKKIHFLGCGGLDKVKLLKNSGFNEDYFSVDVSTPINRAIDGNTSNTAFSGYYNYADCKLYRINDKTANMIINMHKEACNPIFSVNEMKEIVASILAHQNGNSSQETYNARAKLIIHNNDVYKQFAKKN
ncbi:hypothetical protein [Clostridium perfringens]|uniref:hypothetical protein n=1 Tax=Clostridium perfringens TaxID=1502 RepID=UPI000E124BC9|nr:hypothetical protein [Clostridium perfringens]SUY37512.1 Uncharacterised protein [Clostridium perfringens]